MHGWHNEVKTLISCVLQVSMFLKSVRSVGQTDNTSAFSGADNPFQVATYRGVAVTVEGIEAASLVLARKDLVDISLVRMNN